MPSVTDDESPASSSGSCPSWNAGSGESGFEARGDKLTCCSEGLGVANADSKLSSSGLLEPLSTMWSASIAWLLGIAESNPWYPDMSVGSAGTGAIANADSNASPYGLAGSMPTMYSESAVWSWEIAGWRRV